MTDHDPRAALVVAARRAARGSLASFVRLFWPVLNPGTPLIWGRHMDALCAHLEAVSARRIRSVVINIPPGHSKSTIVSQCWPCWEWLHYPHRRWLFASHSLTQARRDSRFRRDILQSELYAAIRPGFSLRLGAKTTDLLANDHNGSMRVVSVGSNVTGDHADTQVIDDPIEPGEVTAQACEDAVGWYGAKFSSRVRDNHATVLVQQRVDALDLSGHMLDLGVDCHICLPAEYDPAIDPGPSPLGWRDWRKQRGQMLYPERFTREDLAANKRKMGSAAYAAQFGQAPGQGDAEVFRREWWGRYQVLPSTVTAWCSVADLAIQTGERNDYSVIQVWALSAGRVYCAEQIRGRWELPDQVAQAIALLRRWPQCQILHVEDRAQGASFLTQMRGKLRVSCLPWTGWKKAPKEVRIKSVAPHAEAGQILWPAGAPWVDCKDGVLDEFARAGRPGHDDQADTTAIMVDVWRHHLRLDADGEPAAASTGGRAGRAPPRARLRDGTFKAGKRGLGSH